MYVDVTSGENLQLIVNGHDGKPFALSVDDVPSFIKELAAPAVAFGEAILVMNGTRWR